MKTSARLFFHQAEKPEESLLLFERLTQELREDYQIIESSPNNYLMKHIFLNTFFAIERKGVFIFGIEREPNQESIIKVLEIFRRELSNEK